MCNQSDAQSEAERRRRQEERGQAEELERDHALQTSRRDRAAADKAQAIAEGVAPVSRLQEDD